ncbi:bacteriohemerythrin [Helicobacter sp.]|uniref:bacteriohemerythrin n=1 Tax=Helicobacter sp. TaxID=218 RepID=UPI0025B90B5A|nr:hemerythrin family protein [Helicobacter sp.]MCI5968249.1 hemerythrin family protein [Helicobacter sp.]MDY2585471.1 hemerythrin family protein [Helicobacter sp.]
MLEWSEEFSIKNQNLDEHHKKFMQQISEALELTEYDAEDKPQKLEKLINSVMSSAQEHFKAEETYMQHIGYPFLDKHKTFHREFVSNISMLMMELEDAKNCAQEFYNCLKNWLIDHILVEDKQIESYRNRLYDIKEIPYSLEQRTKILAERVDVENEPKHKYICLCHLKEFQVCDSLHKIMQEEGTFMRCKTCKQPLIYRDLGLDDEDNFEALAKQYFKQF